MFECRNMARKLCKCKKYLFTKYSDVQIGNMCVCVRVGGGRGSHVVGILRSLYFNPWICSGNARPNIAQSNYETILNSGKEKQLKVHSH